MFLFTFVHIQLTMWSVVGILFFPDVVTVKLKIWRLHFVNINQSIYISC